jgi:hypothetical protein
VSTSYRTKRIREGGRDGRLGWPLGWFAKKEGRKEKRKTRKEEFAKIHLNFEKFKLWSKWWW